MTRRIRWVGLVAGTVLLAGCTSAAPQVTSPAAHVGHTAPQPVSAQAVPAASAPTEAALQLQSLLGQHAVLAADMMRGRIRNDEDFGQAANAAIGTNTDALAGIVGSLFGAPAGARFAEIWATHVTALFNYSRGLATNDTGVRDEAKATLLRYEDDLAGFFSGASQGRLSVDAAKAAVLAHVDHLTGQADAYAAKDYARSDEGYRTGYTHAFGLGHTLAATLLPPDQAAALEAPGVRLRAELNRLLGEHVALAIAALRAGGTNSPDFATAAASLNANTADLAGAIGTLFGAAAAGEFLSLWADHVDHLVGYTSGVVAGDAARKADASTKLRDFETRLAAFLEKATGNRLKSADLAKAYLAHDEMLLRQVDAFAAKDYPQAQTLAYDTYRDMFEIARQLAEAFGETVAARLPQGGAATGGGGLGGG